MLWTGMLNNSLFESSQIVSLSCVWLTAYSSSKSLIPVKVGYYLLFPLYDCIQCQESWIKHSFGEEDKVIFYIWKYHIQIVKDIKCYQSLKLVFTSCIKILGSLCTLVIEKHFFHYTYIFSNVELFGIYLKIKIKSVADILIHSTVYGI